MPESRAVEADRRWPESQWKDLHWETDLQSLAVPCNMICRVACWSVDCQ